MNATADVLKLAIESLEDHHILTDEMDTVLVRHIRGLEADRERLRNVLESIALGPHSCSEEDCMTLCGRPHAMAKEALTPKTEAK